MRIHFVRHGESEANVLHVIANRCAGYGLTETGRDQVQALCDHMSGTLAVGVWTSPLLRARQTAEALATTLGVALTESAALLEFDCGQLEGRGDPAAWDEHMGILRAWLLDRSFSERLPGGENALEVRDRLSGLVRYLCEAYEATEAEVILVGHAGLYAIALPFLMPAISHEFAFQHPVRKAGRVLAEVSQRGFQCISWDGMLLSVNE